MVGTGSDTPREHVLYVVRAESRVRIIEHLLESESATQRELRSDLDAARTTVSRSLQSLVERGWVVRETGTYRLTRTGRVLATEFVTMLETIQTVEELAEFLRWFPTEIHAPAFHDVTELEVTYPTEADPYAPARKQTEIIHTAERLRILLPAIDLDSTETITERVTQHGLEVETVVSPAVEETLESEEFRSLIRAKMATNRSTIYVAQTALPFYLGLSGDGRVQVGIADEEGFPRALLETPDETIREWAEDLYETYRDDARHKPPHEL